MTSTKSDNLSKKKCTMQEQWPSFLLYDRAVVMFSLFFDTPAFVLLKGKGDLGQKATPGGTNR